MAADPSPNQGPDDHINHQELAALLAKRKLPQERMRHIETCDECKEQLALIEGTFS